MSRTDRRIVLEARGLWKRFGGTEALRDVSLTLRAGEVTALVGENGAGKSTLGQVLAGAYPPDRGEILLEGRSVRFGHPYEARRAGIVMVHQERLSLPDRSVAENVLLGRWPARRGLVDDRALRAEAKTLLARVGLDVDLDRPLGGFPPGVEQRVRIAHALGFRARVLVLDEPTSALGVAEAESLFRQIERLRGEGIAIVFVSHRIEEVRQVADRAVVLRDGRVAAELDREGMDPDALVAAMLGRALQQEPEPLPDPPEEAPFLLEVRDLRSPRALHGLSFAVRSGEAVGLAGLIGAGRSETLHALAGLDPNARGEVFVGGRRVRPGDPDAALAAGVALVPEDRTRDGLALGLSVRENVSIAHLDRLRRRLGRIDVSEERFLAAGVVRRMNVRPPDLERPVGALSGGNQQKVLLGRWVERRPRVLLVDEPTRGVDVGAKVEIHRALVRRLEEGAALVVASSELPELLRLCHRVLVLRGGRIRATVPRKEATAERLLRAMSGL